jgi:photosystem II stability/assembly factor-like uncharacterized protein
MVLAVALAICNGCASDANQVRHGMARRGAPIWFASLQMVSPLSGWALRWTQDPDALDSATLAAVRTTDGGRLWSDATPPAARSLLTPTMTAAVLFARDSERAWLAVSRDRGRRTVTAVFATANGGATWVGSSIPFAVGRARWLDFVDPRHGWLMTDLGSAMGSEAVAVYRTRDAGVHWSLVSRTRPLADAGATERGGLPLRCDKTGITFATKTVGWITNACDGAENPAWVTHDGGAHWAVQRFPIAPATLSQLCRSGCQVAPPTFFGKNGVLTLSSPTGEMLFVTDDTGVRWTTRRLPATPNGSGRIDFVNAKNGFWVPGQSTHREDGLLYTTGDAGRTWTPVRAGLELSRLGESVDFVSASAGFIWTLGSDSPTGAPAVDETGDGAHTWTRIVPRLWAASSTTRPMDTVRVSWSKALRSHSIARTPHVAP